MAYKAEYENKGVVVELKKNSILINRPDEPIEIPFDEIRFFFRNKNQKKKFEILTNFGKSYNIVIKRNPNKFESLVLKEMKQTPLSPKSKNQRYSVKKKKKKKKKKKSRTNVGDTSEIFKGTIDEKFTTFQFFLNHVMLNGTSKLEYLSISSLKQIELINEKNFQSKIIYEIEINFEKKETWFIGDSKKRINFEKCFLNQMQRCYDKKNWKIAEIVKFETFKNWKNQFEKVKCSLEMEEWRNEELKKENEKILMEFLNKNKGNTEEFVKMDENKKNKIEKATENIQIFFQDKLDVKNKIVNRLGKEISNLEDKKVEKCQEIFEFKKKIEELTKNLNVTKEELKKRIKRIKILKKFLKNNEKEKNSEIFKKKNNEVSELELEKTKFENEVESIKKELKQKNNLTNLENELIKLELKLQQKQKELELEKHSAQKMKKLLFLIQKETLYSVSKTDIRNVSDVIFKHAKYVNENGKKRILNEIEKHEFFSKQLGEEMFVKFFGAIEFDEYKKFTLIIEKCDMDLKQFIGKTKPSLEDKLSLLIKSAKAFNIIHKNNRVHLDIKPENIFIKQIWDDKSKKEIQIKLGDFEEVKCIPSNGYLHKNKVGTYNYMDPNIVDLVNTKKLDCYLKQRDCYSFGIMLFCLVYMKTPFGLFMKRIRKKNKIFHQKRLPEEINRYLRENEKENVFNLLTFRVNVKKKPKLLNELIVSCCNKDETKRPTFTEIEKQLILVLENLESDEVEKDLIKEKEKSKQKEIDNNLEILELKLTLDGSKKKEKLLSNKNKELQKEIECLSDKLNKEKFIDTFRGKNNSGEDENKLAIEIKEKDLKIKQFEINLLELNNKESEEKNFELKKELKVKNDRIVQLEKELVESNKKDVKLESRGENKELKVIQRIIELEKEKELRNSEIVKFKEELEFKSNKIVELEKKLEELRQKNVNLVSDCENKDIKISKIESELKNEQEMMKEIKQKREEEKKINFGQILIKMKKKELKIEELEKKENKNEKIIKKFEKLQKKNKEIVKKLKTKQEKNEKKIKNFEKTKQQNENTIRNLRKLTKPPRFSTPNKKTKRIGYSPQVLQPPRLYIRDSRTKSMSSSDMQTKLTNNRVATTSLKTSQETFQTLYNNFNSQKEKVINLKQSDLKEIFMYVRPPYVVKQLIFTIFVFFGVDPKKLSRWHDCRKLIKNELIERVKEFYIEKYEISEKKIKFVENNFNVINRSDLKEYPKECELLYNFLLSCILVLKKMIVKNESYNEIKENSIKKVIVRKKVVKKNISVTKIQKIEKKRIPSEEEIDDLLDELNTEPEEDEKVILINIKKPDQQYQNQSDSDDDDASDDEDYDGDEEIEEEIVEKKKDTPLGKILLFKKKFRKVDVNFRKVDDEDDSDEGEGEDEEGIVDINISRKLDFGERKKSEDLDEVKKDSDGVIFSNSYNSVVKTKEIPVLEKEFNKELLIDDENEKEELKDELLIFLGDKKKVKEKPANKTKKQKKEILQMLNEERKKIGQSEKIVEEVQREEKLGEYVNMIETKISEEEKKQSEILSEIVKIIESKIQFGE